MGQYIALKSKKNFKKFNIKKIYNPSYIESRRIDKDFIAEYKKLHGDYFLMVGRFTEQKDQTTVVRALKILKDKYGIDKKLIFVGDGYEKSKVEKLVRNLELDDLVVFEGNKLEVQNYYKAAYMFIHSSPAEGLPTVIIEAMSFGLPVVATNSLPGVEEILGEDKYGLVCRIGDPEDMANKVMKVLNDEKVYNHYIKQGLRRAEDFNPENIKKQLKNALEDLT